MRKEGEVLRRAEKEADRLYLMVEVEQKQAFIQGVRFAIALAEKGEV